MNTPMPSNGREGFSLIEILVVLVLVSILSSVAVPRMSGYVDRHKTRRALDQVVADVSHARLLAVQRGRRASMTMAADGSYSIRLLANDGSWTTVKSVSLGAEYPGIAVSGGLTNLQFSSRGILETVAADGFIKISRGSIRDSVFVSPAGRVYRAY